MILDKKIEYMSILRIKINANKKKLVLLLMVERGQKMNIPMELKEQLKFAIRQLKKN